MRVRLWWSHSLEIKPSRLSFGKVLLGRPSTLALRLQSVGISTVRFRIYPRHPDLTCSNTSPPGPLAPGMQSVLHTTLLPTVPGPFVATLQVVSGDEVLTVTVTATVLERWVEH